MMGQAYHAGNGVARNFESAAFWYRKSAENGDCRAMANLGQGGLHSST